MVQLNVTVQGKSVPMEVSDEMRNATNEQILSYVQELYPDLDVGDMQVERTAEGLMVHPTAPYG